MPNVNNKEAAVIAIEVITTNRKTTTLLIIQILIMIVIVLIVHQPVVKTLVQKVMSNLRQVIIVIPPVRSLVYPDKSSPKGDKAPSLSHSNNSDMTRHDEDFLSQENCGASENHFHDFRGGGDCEEVVLSLPPSSTKHKSEKHPQNSKKSRQNNNKKNKNKKSVSKHQKLLRKRYEKTRENDFTKNAAANAGGTGNNDEDEDDSSSRQDVKCNYSIVYFNWAVSDSEDSDDDDDEESEDGPVTNVTIPLFKNLKISS